MGISIGGKTGRRGYSTPDNKNMSTKANARIEHYVAASNVRLNEALKVDGAKVLLWQRQPPGGQLCSCHGGFKASMAAQARAKVPNTLTGSQPEVQPDSVSDDDDYAILGLGTRDDQRPPSGKRARLTAQNYDNPADETKFLDTDKEQAFRSAKKINANAGVEAFDDVEFVDATDDAGAANALAPRGSSSTGTSTSEGSSCPVCAAATYVYGWQPICGRRSVMSFLPNDIYDTEGELDTSTKPWTLALNADQQLRWTMKVPLVFSSVERVSLWSGKEQLVSTEFVPEVYTGVTWVAATPKNIMALMGTAVSLSFRITAPRRVILTHFDIIVLLADLPYAQFPPLNAPWEPEMQEYMANITAEMGADAIAAPGDLITDFKHQKMWRITNVVRKFTSGGRAMQIALDLRAVQAYESYFSLHLFQNYIENGAKTFAGQNEQFQGEL